MEKVGIITLNGYKNYGNRLQNYALQEAIKSIGFQAETILIDQGIQSPPTKLQRMKNLFSLSVFKKIIRKIYATKNKKLIEDRTIKFKEFSNKYIHETSYSISEESLPMEKLSQYKSFITGSDQVWNPNYISGSSLYFLSFAPKSKRISYAASFGVSNIQSDFREIFKKNLLEMNALAVREEQGANIIKELTGRDALVVIDPTMLLTKEMWRGIKKPFPKKPTTPYILTYFLGEVSNNTKMRVNTIAKEKKLEIVNLASLEDSKYYTADPSEFIDFIDSAEVFCTDSFHGVVFSILLETPFIVFERQGRLPSMNSRIETILSKFNFESRLAKNISTNDQICNIDYSHVDNLLEQEREKAYNYLVKALN